MLPWYSEPTVADMLLNGGASLAGLIAGTSIDPVLWIALWMLVVDATTWRQFFLRVPFYAAGAVVGGLMLIAVLSAATMEIPTATEVLRRFGSTLAALVLWGVIGFWWRQRRMHVHSK